MTEKENYFKVINGETPDWVPKYTFIGGGETSPTAMVGPRLFRDRRIGEDKSMDCWGVTYVPVAEAGGASLPEPGNFILKDVCDWRDVIKAPDYSDYDFEAEAKEQLSHIDRSKTAVMFDLNGGVFQLFMSFMGFSEGLCAMYEEPEEVKALLSYVADFIVSVNEKAIDYYQPDICALVDDTATWKNPFISVEMYRELIKPLHARISKTATDRGLKIDMHDCGRCEDFIDDWLDFGVVSWNPAQPSNDLLAIQKKYKGRLVIEGGFQAAGELLDADVSEEKVKQAVYDTLDKFAPGGGYMFMGGFLGAVGDPVTAKKNQWVQEAYLEYRDKYYK